MKNLQISTEGNNYTSLDLGEFENLMDYSFLHPRLKNVVQGKIFVGNLLKATGAEISFSLLPPHTVIPFLHQHKNHEEIYIVIKGSGQFQVDGVVFDIKEGSVIRVAPDGKRSYRNNSDHPLIVMCIQSQKDSLDNFSVYDGYRTPGEIPWPDK
jgi:mannose-6-phosphate isomerase-like protein (cupin superfamily)